MSAEGGNVKLLLVDDETDFLDATARALGRRGFDVTTAPDGETALKLLGDRKFDVVILDIKMPGIDGIEVFRRIQASAQAVPVIMLTGHGTLRSSINLKHEGAYEYLAKPCSPDKLAQVARDAVENTRRASAPAAGAGDAPDINLLVVDDEPFFLEGLQKALKRRGMSVETAQNGTEALALLESRSFDVALLDIKMPGIGGIDLLRIIKDRFPAVEVILLTGHPNVEQALEGMSDGAFDYLRKPQAIEALVLTIQCAFTKCLEGREKGGR
jgi:DNA-binding NtrC family response regulator